MRLCGFRFQGWLVARWVGASVASERRGEGKRIARTRASYAFPGNGELGVEIFKRLTGWLESGRLWYVLVASPYGARWALTVLCHCVAEQGGGHLGRAGGDRGGVREDADVGC